jgi:hypothetical protein
MIFPLQQLIVQGNAKYKSHEPQDDHDYEIYNPNARTYRQHRTREPCWLYHEERSGEELKNHKRASKSAHHGCVLILKLDELFLVDKRKTRIVNELNHSYEA